MVDPASLYAFTGGEPELSKPVLVHALSGFVDAGHAGAGFAEHLLANFDTEIVARFDVDLLLDYRARRPEMRFIEDHFEGYKLPELLLRAVRDADGTGFLLLTGPEPDVMWERFIAAVIGLVERFDVRLTVGLHGIPMAVPHTRPLGVTMHGTRKDLVTVVNPWRGEIRLPSSVSSLLELRLGEHGHDAMGVVAHVPHYLSDSEYPDASIALARTLEAATGLVLPVGPLADEAERNRVLIQQQVEQSDEVGRVVEALETQYDAFTSGEGRGLLADSSTMPTAEEIGAEFERFLADLDDGSPS